MIMNTIYVAIQLVSVVLIITGILYHRILGECTESIRNYMLAGNVNKIKDRDILRCIANYNAGNMKAKIIRKFCDELLVLNFYVEKDKIFSINVDDIDTDYFGNVYEDIGYVNDWESCYYTGNISVYTKRELLRIKNEILGFTNDEKDTKPSLLNKLLDNKVIIK